LNFELSRALRRIKPNKIATVPMRRSESPLPRLDDAARPGRELLLDTTVYIDVLQGRAPDALKSLLRVRPTNHSSVILGELTYLFGRLDPNDIRTPAVLRAAARAIDTIPAHRLTTPSVRATGEAGIMAGVIARLRSVSTREPATLNDALLYAQALERGLVVLTRNTHDFDLFDRLWPSGSVLFYQTA
jgi:predicted nucleic acid-binding protein